MTDNEIIKALECCKSMVTSCEECPMHIEGVICHEYELNEKALDIIKRQQAEIDKLNAENMLTTSERNAFRTSFYDILKQLKSAKSEAIKEFTERLKEKSFKTIRNYGLTKDVVEVCDIDNLVKEMVGDK